MRKAFRLGTALACAAVLAAPFAARAGRVDSEKARGLARRVAESTMGKTAAADVRLSFAAKERGAAPFAGGLKRTAAGAEDTLFYVFDLGGGGFVIVSADDAVKPVLGYSYGGRYAPQSLPPNAAAWLDGLRRQILWAREQGLEPGEEARREWARYSGGAAAMPLSAAAPLLETEWDQYEPYNLLCPTIEGARAAAGCAITAWAQIMKFHGHPARGVGRSEAYVTDTYKISIPSVSFETDYKWNEMLDVYPEEDESNSPQNVAVATLMYHLGVSVKADYLPEGSIADGLAGALTEHFGYDKGMRRVDRDRFQRVYGKAAWEALLKGQLDAGRPVLYGATDPRAGHEFVVDGYDNSGKFYINWGWGGRYNGYYEIDALVGVSAEMYDFSNVRYQYAYVDIKPNAGGVSVTHAPNFTLAEFAASKTDVAPAEAFSVTARVTCDTAAYIDAARQMLVGAALTTGARDSIVAVIGNARANIYPWKSDTVTTISCAAPGAVPAGAYNLKIAVSEYEYNPATREYAPLGWKIVATAAPGVQSGIAVNVVQAPVITAQPSNQRAAVGASATFTVAAASNGTAAVTGYQWQSEIADTILAENFDGAAGGYTVVNGTQGNKWSVGSAAAGLSGKAAYISNDGGASNAYSASSASAAHIYMDIAFPPSTDSLPFTLAFDWKGMGKHKPLDCYSVDDSVLCVGFGGGVDYMRVTLAEPGVSPKAGDAVEGLDLGIYYNSNAWKKALYQIPASNAGKTKRLVFTWYNEATDGAVNPPIAIDNITVTANHRFADVKDGSGAATAAYATPAATPEMHGARYRCVVTNAVGMSTISDAATLWVGDMESAVSAAERAVPAPFVKTEASVPPPPARPATGLTAGPNPAGARRAAPVRFFRDGARVENATLYVYDASGVVVRKIAVSDGGAGGARRQVGEWDLTDNKGRRVPEGAYLVKGAVKTPNGKREPVSAVVSVR